jgi:hypothetical protein
MNKTGDSATPKRVSALSRQVGDELIVYDSETHQAHCLNYSATAVWKSCDGQTTVSEMVATVQKVLPGIDKQVVFMALLDLQEAGLLVKGTLAIDQHRSLSRRNALRRIGKVAAVALPVVTSLLVPTPSVAASCFPLGHACTRASDCCSGRCGLSLLCL